MQLILISNSASFKAFLATHLAAGFEHYSELSQVSISIPGIYLLHVSSLNDDHHDWIRNNNHDDRLQIAILDDQPDIQKMLSYTQLGVKSYCNSHMSPALYEQMLRLVRENQSWFPPHLLEQVFALAQRAQAPQLSSKTLQALTQREAEIARSVASGQSNQQIAASLSIEERTVKSHLTNIFKKLDINSRVALVLLLKD